MLDERLSLILSLYEPCELAADIGTDHARLPTALLRKGVCRRMILTDISRDALERARAQMIRARLTDRAELRLGNGLEPLREACGCISVTGMGGRTIREILLAGQDRLRGATLILSGQTDFPLLRRTLTELGYAPDREEPCLSGGHFYLVIRARPGLTPLTEREIRLGGPLYQSRSPTLIPFLRRWEQITRERLEGLLSAKDTDPARLDELREDLDSYHHYLEEHQP